MDLKMEIPRRCEVVCGSGASDLERFAARELCDFLGKLYQVETELVDRLSGSARIEFLVGLTACETLSTEWSTPLDVAALSDQGFFLKTQSTSDRTIVAVGGGSPRAVLWAVYELAERCGVRFLTSGDVYPPIASLAEFPALDLVLEPRFSVRAHPSIQDFAPSGEAWGIADFKKLIDQLAKLKFSRINVFPFAWQPFLHWECKGIARSSFWLWYNDHLPLTPDTIGRELFPPGDEFWNPDLPLHGSYRDSVIAGERLIHQIIEHAHLRGMECGLYADLTQFTPEFAPLLKDAQTVHQVGRLTVVPGSETGIDDEQYYDLAVAVLQASLNTYPEADFVAISMPEWRQWVGVYERAWDSLHQKYGIGNVQSLDETLKNAANRKWGRGEDGSTKALDEVKGDIALLYFYDKILHNPDVVGTTKRPDIRFHYHGVAEELFPVLEKLLPAGSEVGTIVDNYPTKILARREVLKHIPGRKIASIMDLTIDDDNIGIIPQLSTSILHELLGDLAKNGWAGFVARERFPGDHDSALAYLAKASWDSGVTAESVLHDQITNVCGSDCVDDMMRVYEIIESVTALLETEDSDFAFPLPGVMMQYWDGRCFNGVQHHDGGPMLPYLDVAIDQYQEALDAATRSYARVTSRPEKGTISRGYVDFWIGRIDFSMKYMEAVKALRQGGRAEAAHDDAVALTFIDEALAKMDAGLRSYARVARNGSDLGAIAFANQHCYRELLVKKEQIEARLSDAKVLV